MCLTPCDTVDTRRLCPWDFPGKNAGVGCLSLLQGIFPTQGLNPGLQHCRQILYCLSHQGSPVLLLLLLSHFSHVRLCATPETEAHQAPLSMGFSRQEHWSGLPCPLPGDLPDPGIEARSPTLQADALPSEPPGKPDLPLEKPVCRSGATVRTGHGTTDWFQTGKRVRQGCILSPCLFNFYAESS